MAPQRAERALTEQRWDDASRFGAGRPRSPSRGYLEIPSAAPKTPTQGACSITIERGRRLALGTALLHWPVLPRPQLAGFQVSTEGVGARPARPGSRRGDPRPGARTRPA